MKHYSWKAIKERHPMLYERLKMTERFNRLMETKRQMFPQQPKEFNHVYR